MVLLRVLFFTLLEAFLLHTGIGAVLIKPLKNITVTTGEDVVLRCNVENDFSDTYHSWTRQGIIVYAKDVQMFQDERIDLLSNKPDEYTIKISKVTPADEGQYICTTYGRAAEVYKASLYLTVNVPPVMKKVSKDLTIDEGSIVTFECLAVGKPKPQIFWRHIIPSADGRRANSELLPLGKVTRESAGNYECTADNGVSSPVIRTIGLVVRYPPEIDQEDRKAVLVKLMGTAEISCFASGYPEPKFSWHHPSGKIYKNKSSSPRFNIVKLNEGSTVQSTLLIAKVEKTDFGNWTCVAANSLGSDSQDLTLKRKHLPPTRLPPSLVFNSEMQQSGKGGNNVSRCQHDSTLMLILLIILTVLPAVFL